MTAASAELSLELTVSKRSHAVRMLQVFTVVLMVFPSDYIIKSIGAGGYFAAIVAYLMFLAWIAATLFGQHDAFASRYPVRIALAGFWVATLASYSLMNRGSLSTEQLSGADRWLLQLADISGVVLLCAECLHSIEDIRRVIRTLTYGAAFCGIVALLQFKGHIDLVKYIERIPGFTLNAATYSNIESRGSLSRVVGTAIHPIELGVVAAMVLTLAVYLAIYDTGRSAVLRWAPVICISVAIPASVSRSAIIAVAISMGTLIISFPPVRRLKGMAAVVCAVVVAFATTHGLIHTFAEYFTAGSSDSSLTHRVDNYPMVIQLVSHAPWFGYGGGTYLPLKQQDILDNQYLTTAIELGIFGLAAFIFFCVWPAITALVARGRTKDPELRDLCAALAGSALAAVICSGTFDSLSFPMFANVQALVAGLAGAVWMLVNTNNELTTYNDGGL